MHGFPNDIRTLLNEDACEERVLYTFLAPFGMLFDDFYGIMTAPVQSKNFCSPNDFKRNIYDKVSGKWVDFTQELYEIIPKTFTFAPRPVNIEMEMDYFVRSFGLPKHHFVWSNKLDGIPKEIFAGIRSVKNGMFRGRYTFTPWLPQIEKLGRLYSGFYMCEDDDNCIIFN